jgi:hypothetical protein
MNSFDPNSSRPSLDDSLRRLYNPHDGQGHSSTTELDQQISLLAHARSITIMRQRKVAGWAWVGTAVAAGLALAAWWPVMHGTPTAVSPLSADVVQLDVTGDRRVDVLDALTVSAQDPEHALRILREAVRVRATFEGGAPRAKG